MVFVYTTCKDMDEAKRLGKKLIEEKIAACVNMWPIESAYSWQGELKEDTEAVLLIKTNEPKVAEIENFILKNHTYSTPFVGVINLNRLNREYKEWMVRVMG